jgi:hypothetical protein
MENEVWCPRYGEWVPESECEICDEGPDCGDYYECDEHNDCWECPFFDEILEECLMYEDC